MPSPFKTSGTTEKLVISAATLFARQGYHGTNTRDIARIAGVSENTLFRHFDNKEALFWAALEWHTRGLTFRRDLQEGLKRNDPPEVIFPKIFELLADTATYKTELIRLIAVAFLELHYKIETYCEKNLSPMITAIHHYLALNVQRGVIADLDPTMLTAAFMTLAATHPGVSRLVGGSNSSHADSREAARSYARFWLNALVPKVASNAGETAATNSAHGPNVDEAAP
jgi:AcrR family transcriptional regulator